MANEELLLPITSNDSMFSCVSQQRRDKIISLWTIQKKSVFLSQRAVTIYMHMCKKHITGYTCKTCIDGKILERIFFSLMVEMSRILDKPFIYLNIIS